MRDKGEGAFMRATAAVLCLLLAMPALADDLTGQASIIDGDTFEIHGTRIRLGGSTLPKAASSAVTKTATYIDAALRRQMISIVSSHDDPSTVFL
jgi:endonuclease YncB( thermonuclease family)